MPMPKVRCPNCGCELPTALYPVPLPGCHVAAADVVARRTLEFIEAVAPVLAADDELHSSHDRRDKLMPLITLVQDAIDSYAEIRIGCATRLGEPYVSLGEAIDPQHNEWPPAPETERSVKQ